MDAGECGWRGLIDVCSCYGGAGGVRNGAADRVVEEDDSVGSRDVGFDGLFEQWVVFLLDCFVRCVV